jgi:hypothetical protein
MTCFNLTEKGVYHMNLSAQRETQMHSLFVVSVLGVVGSIVACLVTRHCLSRRKVGALVLKPDDEGEREDTQGSSSSCEENGSAEEHASRRDYRWFK